MYKNRAKIDKDFADKLDRIHKIIDIQHQILNDFSMILAIGPIFGIDIGSASTITFSASTKNLIAFISTLELLRSGLHGPGRVLLRQAFEALLMAKFCSVSQDSKIYELWLEGKIIRFAKDVIHRIAVPDNTSLNNFWFHLCRYSHATTYSQQASLDSGDEDERRGVELTLVFLDMLLECNYHLINIHFVTPSMKWHLAYIDESSEVKLRGLKLNQKNLLKDNRNLMTKESRKVVNSYKRAWQLN